MKRVLIIDDAALVRAYYRQALERAGYEVDEALNGLEGLEKDLPARDIIAEQDREVAEKSGKPALAIKTLVRA